MRLFQSMVVVCALAGCGLQSAGVEEGAGGKSGNAEALNRPAPPSHWVAERDLRACFQGPCGGWFVRPATDPTAHPLYVDALSFAAKELDENQLAGAAPGELLFFGRPVYGAPLGVPDFEVHAAWRALPGGAFRKGDTYYSLFNGGEACKGLWCQSKRVVAVDQAGELDVSSFSLGLAPYVHPEWVEARVGQARVIAAGTLVKGSALPAFDGAQVFLRLPEQRSCPEIKPPSCSAGATDDKAAASKVATFSLDSERCLFFAACEAPGACPAHLVQPACAAGYTPREFLASPGACPALTCDPTWAE